MSHQKHTAAEIATFRALHEGSEEVTLAEFRRRWQSPEVTRALQLSRRIVPIQNELTPILDKRVEAMPGSFTYGVDAQVGGVESEITALNEWVDGTAFGTGRSVQSAMWEMAEDQEFAGTIAITMGLLNGEAWARLRDPAGMSVVCDPMDPRELTSVTFRWSVQSGDEEVQYREVITKQGRAVYKGDGGEPIEQEVWALKFVPVVLIPRRQLKGSPLGDSAVPQLLESYLSMLWALYLINVANRYAGKVWCPEGQYDDGWALPDEDDSQATVTNPIVPGMFHPKPIKQVGSTDIPAGALEQFREALAALYRVGKVRRADEGADMRSGKAMLIDTMELRNYTQKKVDLLRFGLGRMADMRAWLTGAKAYPEPCGASVEIPDLVGADPEEQRSRASLHLQGYEKGLYKKREAVFRAWQSYDLIDQDVDVKKLAEEQDQAAEDAMAAMEDALSRELAAGASEDEDQDKGQNSGSTGEEDKADGQDS